MSYKILKWLAKIALNIFFRKIQFTTLTKIPENSPLIVVSNHPNTFMDAILLAALIDREFYFLTNASVFTNTYVKWLLKQLHMIPIYRKQDIENGLPQNHNSLTFEACVELLKNNGALIIFPEGVSEGKRQLKKFKTGTARIALLAESLSHFQLNLAILPVGINYSDPENFRSNVIVNVGYPIYLQTYQESYTQNPVEAVNQLTDYIYFSIQKLVINTNSNSEDELIKNIQTLFLNEFAINPNAVHTVFTIEKEIQQAIYYFSEAKPFELHDLTQAIKSYFYTVHQYKLDDQTISNIKGLKKLYYSSLLQFILLIMLSPLFVVGWFTNWVPYTLPKLVATKLTPYKEYHAGIKLVTGLIAFPLWYFLSYLWLVYLFRKQIYSLFIFAIFPILGFFALNFAIKWDQVQKKLKLVYEFRRNKRKIAELTLQRKEIIKKLKEFQMEYTTHANP